MRGCAREREREKTQNAEDKDEKEEYFILEKIEIVLYFINGELMNRGYSRSNKYSR